MKDDAGRGPRLEYFPRAPESPYDAITLPDPPARRPYVILNMVSTVDGKTTLGGGRVGTIGSPVDRRMMKKIRVPVDGVLRGAGTVRDNPRYPGVPPEQAAVRKSLGLDEQPAAVIVTGSARLPADAPIFRQAPRKPIIIAPESAPDERLRALEQYARIERVGSRQVDFAAAFELLRGKYGIKHLLSEGGPAVNYETFSAGLIDEVFWTVAPKIAGTRDDLTMVTGPRLIQSKPELALKSAFFNEETNELFLRYEVLPPGEQPRARSSPGDGDGT